MEYVKEVKMKPNTKELKQFAEDYEKYNDPWSRWEMRSLVSISPGGNEEWSKWIPMLPTCAMKYFLSGDYQFRRKPKYINIACNIDLPMPIKEEPKYGDTVYAFSLEHISCFREYTYTSASTPFIKALFINGCLFSSKEQVFEMAVFWKEHFAL